MPDEVAPRGRTKRCKLWFHIQRTMGRRCICIFNFPQVSASSSSGWTRVGYQFSRTFSKVVIDLAFVFRALLIIYDCRRDHFAKLNAHFSWGTHADIYVGEACAFFHNLSNVIFLTREKCEYLRRLIRIQIVFSPLFGFPAALNYNKTCNWFNLSLDLFLQHVYYSNTRVNTTLVAKCFYKDITFSVVLLVKFPILLLFYVKNVYC